MSARPIRREVRRPIARAVNVPRQSDGLPKGAVFSDGKVVYSDGKIVVST